jgi:hypothetical protein
MNFSEEIPIKSGSNSIVRIDPESISWQDRAVKIDAITAISFMFSKASGYLSSHGGHIVLHTPTQKLNIGVANYGFMGFGEGENNIQQIINTIIQVVGDRLFSKIITLIFVEKSAVKIGDLTFTHEGIEKSNLVTGKCFIPWSYKPFMGHGSHHRFFLDNGTVSGKIAVFYIDPGSGKQKKFAIVRPDEPNGFLVTHILEFVRKEKA